MNMLSLIKILFMMILLVTGCSRHKHRDNNYDQNMDTLRVEINSLKKDVQSLAQQIKTINNSTQKSKSSDADQHLNHNIEAHKHPHEHTSTSSDCYELIISAAEKCQPVKCGDPTSSSGLKEIIRENDCYLKITYLNTYDKCNISDQNIKMLTIAKKSFLGEDVSQEDLDKLEQYHNKYCQTNIAL